MTYQDSENSLSSGQPVELYEFTYGTDHYRYTSGDTDIVYNYETYQAIPISRSGIEASEEVFKNEIKISIQRSNLFARQFIEAAPERPITLTIYRGHSGAFVTYWKGTVTSFLFNTRDIEIVVSPTTSGFRVAGLRRKYQRLCTYPLYESGCNVNRYNYRITGTVATISGRTITSADFATKANGWFVGGMIVVGKIERLITSHAGSTITINNAAPGIEAGNAFTAYAGCDHTLETCRDKFSNTDNYGGQPWLPSKNPFRGDAIM